MSATLKLKILAIHGYRQSDKAFSAKIGSIRKYFKKNVEFVFIKAPHQVPPITQQTICDEEDSTDILNETDQYGWWFNTEKKEFKATEPSDISFGFQESIDLIEKIFKEHGHFDGLLGFSQGGSFVSILCAMQQKKLLKISFDFAIIISGFKSLCAPHQMYYDEEIQLPALHIYGTNDKIIPTKMAEELSQLFKGKKIITHEGGHYIPGKKSIYNEFLQEMLDKIKNKESS